MSTDKPTGSALITGGAGFIGSHLSELLLDAGWEVFVLDDLSTGSERNVAHLRERRDFHLIVDSVLKNSVVNELVHRCDVVFHLAARRAAGRMRSRRRSTSSSRSRTTRSAGSTA